MNKKRTKEPAEGPSSSSSSSSGVKKLRQTTLPWAPKPRGTQPQPPTKNTDSDATVSPHFTSSRRRQPESSGTSLAEVSGGPDTSSNRESGGRSFSRDHSSLSSFGKNDPAAPRQLFYQVPSWSRKIIRVNMSSKKNPHVPSLQEVACQQLCLCQDLINSGVASANSTLYIEERGKPSPFQVGANDGDNEAPGLKCGIRVENGDTVDTAIRLIEEKDGAVCILNMANAYRQGGGWLEGTTAQEETICYRTTLIPTLKISYYPIPDVYPMPDTTDENLEEQDKFAVSRERSNHVGVIFSPKVAINRNGGPYWEPYAFDGKNPKGIFQPMIISVVSAAAVDLRPTSNHERTSWDKYPVPELRDIMKDKIRLILRVTVRRRMRRLVLGAFGCGVFRNPPWEVATLFAEVFQEDEFQGGWWEEIVFAIKVGENGQGGPNLEAFNAILNDMKV